MFLVSVGTLIAATFLKTLRSHDQHWEEKLVRRLSIKLMSIVTFLVWVAVIVLGRLIAYDHVWGAWSPAHRI
jgi:hypothetical protein